MGRGDHFPGVCSSPTLGRTNMLRPWMLVWVPILTFGCLGGPDPSGSVPPHGEVPSAGNAPNSPTEPLTVLDARVSFSQVEASVRDDPRVESIVAPYRSRMGEEIRQVIGETTGMLSKSVPEGTLGNFATDAMLWAANRSRSEPVTMALTNNGGLRVPIGPGPITVGQIYELMPFENMLSILVLTGSQVRDLCNQLAEKRGEPIAGFTFHIEVDGDGHVAGEILVGGEPLELEAEYRLVTNDYMANGGDSFSALLTPLAREDLPVLLRDAFIDYLKFVEVIEPTLEGRITGGIGR